MTGFGGTAKPQLRLFVIRKDAKAIPPALAQLVSGHGEAGIPELLQDLHLFCFFFLCVFIDREDLFRVLVGLRHLPLGCPGVEHGVLIFVHLILHPRILKGEHTKPEIVCFPDDHVFDSFELLLL